MKYNENRRADNEFVKRKIVFTLFEAQAMRNIIFNNEGLLLKNLMHNFSVTVFTNKELSFLVLKLFRTLEIDNVDIKIIQKFHPNFVYKCLSVIARNMNVSTSNKWSRNRNYALGNFSLIGLIGRRIIHKLFAGSKFMHEFLRRFITRSCSINDLDLHNVLNQCEILILTSATNFVWDVPIGQIASKKNKFIISIPRSWDNFTSHGALRLNPDLVFSFSPVMTKHLVNYHFINEQNILEVSNPAYDNKKLIPLNNATIRSKRKKILYACMGSFLYEQESLFIKQLLTYVNENGFELEILEHPKFKTQRVKNVDYKVIPYEKFSTDDLLQKYLSKFRLILTAGSSIALDCYNYNLNFMCTFVESKPIKYWLSVKRYTDSVEHFSDFLITNRVKVLNDFDQVKVEIGNLNLKQSQKPSTRAQSYSKSSKISDVLPAAIYRIIDQ